MNLRAILWKGVGFSFVLKVLVRLREEAWSEEVVEMARYLRRRLLRR